MGTRITSLPLSQQADGSDLFVIVDIDQNKTKKISFSDLEGSLQLALSHQQNTDIGTTQEGFLINISGSGVYLKDDGGNLLLRNPSDTLYTDVTGSGLLFDNGKVTGNLYVDGEFFASIKHFYIDHPTKKDKKLIYSSLETPFNGIRLSGSNIVEYGKECVISLPDYLGNFTRYSKNFSINVTPFGEYSKLYVKGFNLEKSELIISVKTNIFKTLLYKIIKPFKKYHFYWDLTAERIDLPELKTEI